MKYLVAFLLAMLAFMTPPQVSAGEVKGLDSDTFTLWQLPNQTRSQIMSYVIQTVHGKVIVIDGGMAGDAPFLAKFLGDLGGDVGDWFITHAHDDHFGALTELLKNPGTPKIGTIHGSLPDTAWMDQWANDSDKESHKLFRQALDGAGRRVEEFSLGQVMEIDGMRVEVLGVKNPEITKNAVNNSSAVLRVADAARSVLFPGDLGVEGGEKLLKGSHAGRLPSDCVQMAHHGQRGVSEAFYKKVHPSCCLWPTPRWLWDNDNGGGVGSGSWQTLEVRAWMDKMAVKRHYVMFEGIEKINCGRSPERR